VTSRIRYGRNVPHWLRRLCARWFRLLLPDDWRLHVQMQDVDDMESEHGTGTRAVTITLPTYLDAAIWFADDTANDADAWRVVAHELRHSHYREIEDLFHLAWDKRRKMQREDVAAMLAELIETLIQRDVAVYAKMTRLP
jgi:hypothetical protein